MSSLLIHNANLLSFHQGFQPHLDSMLIEEGRIRTIGRFEDMQSLVQSGIPLKDAQGKTVMPGFNDTHIHIWKAGNLKTFMLDLRATKSLDEMLSLLSEYNKKYPEVSWITARGFNEASWKGGAIPTKLDLDKVTKDKPIYVIRTCAHIAVVNSKALEIASINAETGVPAGGEMQIGDDGRPNGIFSETALGLVSRFIPAYTRSELKTMILAARDEMYSMGITAATDPAVDPFLLETYHEMNRHQQLGFRLNAIPVLLPDGAEKPFDIPEYFSSPYFKINTVKFFSDGGLSGKTAALKRPYKNSSEYGILRLKKDLYAALCRSSMEKGLGVATHAIGDAAIDFVIEVYKELNALFPGMIKRIEHLGLPELSHLRDMAAYQIAASMQTIFIHELGKNFIRYLDEAYLNHCYPVKSVLQQGILVALSSDAPVVQNFNPLKGAEIAITRLDQEGNTIAPDQAITISEALKAYTADAAIISGIHESGILEEGKWADIIFLNKNPMTTPAVELSKIQVEQTYIGGELVWNKK